MKVAERRRAHRPTEYQCVMLSIKIKALNGILRSCLRKKRLTLYPCWLWIKIKKCPAPASITSTTTTTTRAANKLPLLGQRSAHGIHSADIDLGSTVTRLRNKWNGSSRCQRMIRILKYEKASGSAKCQTGGGGGGWGRWGTRQSW